MLKAEAATSRSVFAPAKINLALHVVGRRDDGYHLLDMLVAFADLGDRVTWRPGGDRCALEISDTIPRPEPIPANTSNLAWRALALAGQCAGAPLHGSLSVEKHLPSGAGIGGGSSDAAATLRAVLGESACETGDVARKALSLGADVPVCLAGKPSRVEGIGERITPLTLAQTLPVVLVWPGVGLSTPAVFRARSGGFGAAIPTASVNQLETDPLGAILGLRNDLEQAARTSLPAVGSALEVLSAAEGCGLARMSGSGSAVVGYFNTREAASSAATEISAGHSSWWVRSGVLMN